VVDFSDEQSYHVGKRMFGNRYLHGAGVLCGLRAERFVFPQGSAPTTPTTVLRVSRGAAIDACGREIVVGSDQCIDVNAWFQANKTRLDLASVTPPMSLRLCVGLRYRDCPSDPAPAPRDPCGCEAGGCEFGRVRESFQLALLSETEQAKCRFTLSPNIAEVERTQAALLAERSLLAPTAATLLEAVHRAVAAGCQDASTDVWLCLACMDVNVDTQGVVTDVVPVENFGPDRRTLLPTSLLQEMLLGNLSGSLLAASSGGPVISGVTFEGSNTTTGDFMIKIQLGEHGTPSSQTPLADTTFDSSQVSLLEFSSSFQWSPINPLSVALENSDTEPVIRVNAGGLEDGGRYRLVLTSPSDQPIVDERMRPLAPTSLALHVRLIDDGSGKLVAASPLF
jgi:hypothetical protein